MVTKTDVLEFLIRHRRQLIVFLAPLVLLPIPLVIDDEKGKCGFMLCLMATYWCTEALPLAVTGFLPVFLAPMFGLLSTKEVCINYFRDTIMLFLGGIIVALSIENSNLHRRIALKVLLICGTKPHWLMLGAMLPAWFLSMWISNTATTAMMLPILEALLQQLHPYRIKEGEEEESEQLTTGTNEYKLKPKDDMAKDVEKCPEVETKTRGNHHDPVLDEYNNFCKVMTLAITYAANVGGIAALTGTSPNVIMTGMANNIWDSHGLGESPVNYTTWMVLGMPLATLNVFVVWIWLLMYQRGFRGLCKRVKDDEEGQLRAYRVIEKQYNSLGKIRYAEYKAGIVFFILVLLWFFRAPGFMPGWAASYPLGWIRDPVPVMFIAFLLFILPYNKPTCGPGQGREPVPTLLNWKFIHEKYPWSVIFIMGGGFALAQCCNVSGLSLWMGEKLSACAVLNAWLMMYLVSLAVAMLTQVTTNSATCTIMMPILSAMSEHVGKNPLYLMFPGAISSSFSFMLPVSNPPNAIAFSYGRLKVLDMVKAGSMLNILGVLTVVIGVQTWGYVFFDMGVIPWEAQNATMTTITTLTSSIP